MADLTTALVHPAVLAAALAFIAKIIRDVWIRHREITSVNTAFLAEIQRLLGVVKEHEIWWDGLRKASTTGHHPLIAFSHPIYKRQVKNLGLLQPAVAGKVAKFYGYLEFLNAFQVARVQYGPSQGAEFDRMYHESLQTFLKTFDSLFREEFQQFGV